MDKYSISLQSTNLLDAKKIVNQHWIKGEKELYLGIIILLALTLFFVIRWLLSRKKASDSQLLLAKKEKNEIELQARLKDEMLKKVKLEKYESLLEIHFKNKKISEMDDTLLGLKNEQDKLNEQIQNFTERLHLYEQEKFKSKIEDTYFVNIAHDVYDRILNKLQEKAGYLKAIRDLDDSFFLNLKNKFGEDLSAINIKYCICFAIGMNVKDIAKCFSIESRSVHRARHRLKSKNNPNSHHND